MNARLLAFIAIPILCLALIGIAIDVLNPADLAAHNSSTGEPLAVANAYVKNHSALTGFTTRIVKQRDDWALVEVIPTEGTTDHALMVMQQKQAGWQVVLGPGTAFPPEELHAHNIPDWLFDQ